MTDLLDSSNAKRLADRLARDLAQPVKSLPVVRRVKALADPERDTEPEKRRDDADITRDGYVIHVRTNFHGAWARISHPETYVCRHGLCAEMGRTK